MTKSKLFIVFLILGILVSSLFLMSCDEERNTVVVASKPHAEQYILGEMISILIEENTDIEVERKMGIGGGTSNIHPAMLSGEVDIYPEYTGTSWMAVLNQEFIEDPQEMYEKTKDEYSEKFELQWLSLYGFNNTYALAIRESVAEEYGLYTYSQLAKVSENLIFGGNHNFYEREDGFHALSAHYGFNFNKTVEMDIGLKYQAIDQQEVDVINAFSTDGLLGAYDLRIIEDDLNFFPSYFAGTVIRQETLRAFPELEEVLNRLAGQISDREMIEMNYRVEELNEDPVKVAREFLEGKDLI